MTQRLVRRLEADVEAMKKAWAEGLFQKDTEYKTAVVEAHQRGRIELAQEILDLPQDPRVLDSKDD